LDEKEKSFLDRITSPLTGDYRKKKPISVKAADVAVGMTPVGSAVEIGEELSKEDPSYGKVAIIAAGDALGAAIPAMGPVAKSLIKQSDKIADLKDVPTVEAAGLTDEAIEKWRKENATKEDFRKSLKGRNEELQEAAAGVEEGRVFTSTYRKLADDLRPIRKVTEVPKPATFVEAVSALNAGKRKKPMIGLNASIPDGDVVTARLDIDAYTDYDVWVPTLTHPELKTVYKPAVVLEDVKFIQPEGREPKKALGVAKGGAKAPFAVMTGKYVEATDDEAYKLAQDVFDNPEFTQVGYDPTRRGFFYDRETGEAIVEADTVVQVGHLVLARNAKKMDAEAFSFSEGGMAIEEQMAMNFGDVPDNTVGVDPVSGNEIPLGSTAENVRDDIPAQLSEGEIVVPADVVRFHGVKLFEDLRAAAKMGYAQMNEDGRIGGEPIPMNGDDEGLGLELTDLEVIEIKDEPQTMSEGGIPKKSYTFDEIKQRMVEKKDEPEFKNRFEKIMFTLFGDDDKEDVKPTRKKAVDKPEIDFGFGGNPMERASRKYGSTPTPTRNESYRPTTTQMNFLGFDEGGDTSPRVVLEGKTGKMLPDDYDPAVDTIGSGTIEMREYQNDKGHTIMIPFINGVPQTVIPEGYFPVGSAPVVTPVGSTQSASGDNDDPGTNFDPPEAIKYEELSLDELTEMVNQQKGMGAKIADLNIFTRFANYDTSRRIKNEIERRIASEDVSEVDKIRYNNLLKLHNKEEPGLFKSLADKVTGKEFTRIVDQIEKPKEPDFDVSDPTLAPSVAEGYTPEPTTPKEPERVKSAAEQIDDSIFQKAVKVSSREAAEKAFSTPSTPKPTPVAERSSGEKEARKGTQNVLKSMRDRGASREERTEAMKEGARVENVRRDLDRGIVRGFKEGGQATKKIKKKKSK